MADGATEARRWRARGALARHAHLMYACIQLENIAHAQHNIVREISDIVFMRKASAVAERDV